MQGVHDGFVKLFCRPGTGIVVGGVVVGPRASELIHPVSIAVAESLTADQLAQAFTVYPSHDRLDRRGGPAAAPGLTPGSRRRSSSSDAGDAPHGAVHRVEDGPPEAPVPDPHLGEAGLPDHPRGVAVEPATLEDPRPRPAEQALRETSRSLAAGGHVLDKSEPAAGSQHASDLGEHLLGVGHRTEHE